MRADVISNFSSAALIYDDHAHVQRDAAVSLVSYANDRRLKLPEGEILEVGSGTGILTQHLISRFADRQLTVSDASAEMLEQCRLRMTLAYPSHKGKLKYEVIDADEFKPARSYAMIASSFALHWLLDLRASIASLTESLKPGGVFLFAVPAHGSFPEWREVAERLQIPFSANLLPDLDTFSTVAAENGLAFHAKQEELRYTYSSPLFFFKSMKLIGAGATIDANQGLSQAKMRRLIRVWGAAGAGRVQVTYRVIFGEIRKPNESKRQTP